MTVLIDKDILVLAEQGMISPFVDHQVKLNTKGKKIPSYGLSACGYDVRLAPEWKLIKGDDSETHDILNDTEECYRHSMGNAITLPPHGFVLARTKETFKLPNDVMGSLFCKSTLARKGLILPPTIAEPGWEGQLVVEIYNANPFRLRIHANIGIGQMVFFKLSDLPNKPYDHTRKYQGQTGIQVGIN